MFLSSHKTIPFDSPCIRKSSRYDGSLPLAAQTAVFENKTDLCGIHIGECQCPSRYVPRGTAYQLFRKYVLTGGNSVEDMENTHGASLFPYTGYPGLFGFPPDILIQRPENKNDPGGGLQLPNPGGCLQSVRTAVKRGVHQNKIDRILSAEIDSLLL